MEKIDLTYLNSVTDGNKEFIIELIGIIKDQLPEFIEEFNTAYAQNDYDALSKTAHKAKSTIAIMGLQSLTDILNKLELEAAKGDNKDSYLEYIQFFEKTSKEGLQQLEVLF